MEKKINIFVACHKPTYVLENPLLIPVQAGTELADQRYQGMKYDNEGDNISVKNPEYCELTAQYWVWKNIECDYYGFFHYRRYLSFANIFPVMKDGTLQGGKRVRPYIELDDIRDDLTEFRLDANTMSGEIVQYDLLTVLREKINTTVYRQYCQYHSKESLDLVLKILSERYPEYQEAKEHYMKSKEIYYMNMYIMKKELFQEYMSWLFNVLSEFERSMSIDTAREPRLMGYLAERLFGIFYTHQRGKGTACAELSYLKFYNTEIDGEVRVRENIRIFRLKPTRYEIKINMCKVNRMFPAGSKRRILLRNIFLR